MSIKHLASIWYIETLHTQYHIRLIIMINIITVLKKNKESQGKNFWPREFNPCLGWRSNFTIVEGWELQEGTVGNLIKWLFIGRWAHLKLY